MISIASAHGSVAALKAWAEELMEQRPCDFWVEDERGLQMERWYVIPRNPEISVYLHRFLLDDLVFHDHPFDSRAVVLSGLCREHHLNGDYLDIPAGHVVVRDALTAHRIGVLEGPVITLFVTGPSMRHWGFVRDGVWAHGPSDPYYAATRRWRA